jgi:peptidyl-prolyl cis-trans isomerase C
MSKPEGGVAMTGCADGAGPCTCGGAPRALPAINGITLQRAGEQLTPPELRERAWSELLRQEAVRTGWLPASPVLEAPRLEAEAEKVVHRMLEQEVPLRMPDDAECARFHSGHPQLFALGCKVHVRHILFAVTPGVDVRALAQRAEQVLLELTDPAAPPGLFAERAGELSNCPSGAQGGDLGWLAPADCAPELGAVLFDEKVAGLHPKLVQSRFGFHIVEVLERVRGQPVPFEQARERIATLLAQRSRVTALHQYIRVLAGRALVEGVDLEPAESPLVQ